MDQQQPHIFCFGLGYVGKAFANKAEDLGYVVTGTSRSKSNSYHFSTLLFRQGQAISKKVLFDHSYILITIPPIDGHDIVFDLHHKDLIDHPNLKWVGYLSTTGVYGDYKGAWVDETTPCHPTSLTTQARYNAEQNWLSLYEKNNLPIHIFRLAGIYGPERSAIDQVKLQKAKRIDKPGQYFSRIHVDDIVQVLFSSMKTPNPGAIYNVCDDKPCASRDVIEYACDLLKEPYPPLIPFEQAELSPMAKRFYKDNRRVKNDKMKQELDITLKYKTFKQGLKSLIKDSS